MNIHFLQSDHGLFLIKKASYGHNLISLTYILGIYSRRHNSLGSFVCNPGCIADNEMLQCVPQVSGLSQYYGSPDIRGTHCKDTVAYMKSLEIKLNFLRKLYKNSFDSM